MATKTVITTISHTFTYDEDSKEFQETFDEYKDIVRDGGTVDSMLTHIAYNIIRRGGCHAMIEGVGYVIEEGETPPADLWSGIYVENEDGDIDFDI